MKVYVIGAICVIANRIAVSHEVWWAKSMGIASRKGIEEAR